MAWKKRVDQLLPELILANADGWMDATEKT